jgi:hypothetical protein
MIVLECFILIFLILNTLFLNIVADSISTGIKDITSKLKDVISSINTVHFYQGADNKNIIAITKQLDKLLNK